MEDELNSLLSQFDEHQLTSLLFNDDTSGLSTLPEPRPALGDLPLNSEPCPRFSLTSDSQLNAAKLSSVSKNTAKSTTWSVNIWKE